jgi:hypothetical protein
LETIATTANAQPKPAKNIATPVSRELPADEGKIAFNPSGGGN